MTSTEETSVRQVAVFTHTHRDEAIAAAVRLISDFTTAGVTSLIPAEDLEILDLTGLRVAPLPEPLTTDDCELVVVLGGDGTILRGAEQALAADLPLLGVNLGHVGFLAEAESSQLEQIASHVIAGTYQVEERITVEVSVTHQGEQLWSSFAVNEVSIEKAARERMVEVLVGVDGEPLSRWGCDGVLIATPTGSTAYAFSAGGPVMAPSLEALLLLPLSAHALFARPLVLAPDQEVSVEIIDQPTNACVVWCDGRRTVEVPAGASLKITRGAHRLRLARLSTHSFTERLVRKFGLRVEGWRGAGEPAT